MRRTMKDFDLIYLSAIPDAFYFLWQIEIQLYNFKRFGVAKEKIHIIIGSDPQYGLSKWAREFINAHEEQASFFTYPDTRNNTKYLSSIRPHLIKKHFQKFHDLTKTAVFYHDSDILFLKPINFDELLKDNIWYVSDTNEYLNADYIKSKGDLVLQEMAQVVGIDPVVVEKNNANSGGAQYLLKAVDTKFWEKVENDCSNLYKLLTENESRYKDLFLKSGEKTTKYKPIQAWCADMWAVLWNGLLDSRQILIHSELDFCWAFEKTIDKKSCKIYHNTGSVDGINDDGGLIFKKTLYTEYSPIYERNTQYDVDYCSIYYVNEINSYRSGLLKNDLSDTSFLIPVKIDSEERMENLQIVTTYIFKHFNTNILILEADSDKKVDINKLPPSVEYSFINDSKTLFHRTKYINKAAINCTTPIISIFDTDAILPVGQIVEAVQKIRYKETHVVSPYDGSVFSLSQDFKKIFWKLLNTSILEEYQNYFTLASGRSYGGSIFFNKNTYLKHGGDNERISSWGPDDSERVKRFEILGYKLSRIRGPLFHLPHSRGINSGYTQETLKPLLAEYLKVANMNKRQLLRYIDTWK